MYLSRKESERNWNRSERKWREEEKNTKWNDLDSSSCKCGLYTKQLEKPYFCFTFVSWSLSLWWFAKVCLSVSRTHHKNTTTFNKYQFSKSFLMNGTWHCQDAKNTINIFFPISLPQSKTMKKKKTNLKGLIIINKNRCHIAINLSDVAGKVIYFFISFFSFLLFLYEKLKNNLLAALFMNSIDTIVFFLPTTFLWNKNIFYIMHLVDL